MRTIPGETCLISRAGFPRIALLEAQAAKKMPVRLVDGIFHTSYVTRDAWIVRAGSLPFESERKLPAHWLPVGRTFTDFNSFTGTRERVAAQRLLGRTPFSQLPQSTVDGAGGNICRSKSAYRAQDHQVLERVHKPRINQRRPDVAVSSERSDSRRGQSKKPIYVSFVVSLHLIGGQFCGAPLLRRASGLCAAWTRPSCLLHRYSCAAPPSGR